MLSDGPPDAAAIYQQLYEAHAGAVLTYLTNKLRDPDTAQDVAQDAWLKAHRGLPDVLGRGDAASKAWVMRIATNAMLDYFDWIKARPKASGFDAVLAGGAVPDALMDRATPEDDVLALSEQAGLRGMVGALLLAVPRAGRELLWWYEYGHRTYAELARRYETTHSAVKARMYRSRQHLDALVASETKARETRTGGLVGRFLHLADRRGGADACWGWTGTVSSGREPWSAMIKVGGKAGRMVPTKRVAYALTHGPIPPWVYPISSCAAGATTICVNPAHLVGACKSGAGVGKSGGHYAPLAPSLLTPDAFDDRSLFARRMALGITAMEMAALVGVKPPNIHQLESTRQRCHRGPLLLQRINATLDRLEREQQGALA